MELRLVIKGDLPQPFSPFPYQNESSSGGRGIPGGWRQKLADAAWAIPLRKFCRISKVWFLLPAPPTQAKPIQHSQVKQVSQTLGAGPWSESPPVVKVSQSGNDGRSGLGSVGRPGQFSSAV
jgi:hypothetical protein